VAVMRHASGCEIALRASTDVRFFEINAQRQGDEADPDRVASIICRTL
jgi:hypothetical protein